MQAENKPQLKLQGIWQDDGRLLAKWSPESRALQSQASKLLYSALKPVISRRCSHLKGHFGVKGAVRYLHRICDSHRFVARFDVNSYYNSIDHRILMAQLKRLDIDESVRSVVHQLLERPDINHKGRGLVAGSSLSPLLGALYLSPLDEAMNSNPHVEYVRYMDDFIILAKSRWHLRRAIRTTHLITARLKLTLHDKQKCFIGRVERGFDFLGYQFHPHHRLQPSAVSLERLAMRTTRLYEQGADHNRLRDYVTRWYQWLHGGLRGYVSRDYGLDWYYGLAMNWIESRTI